MTDRGRWPAYARIGPQRYRERFGLGFDDLRVGLRFQHRPGLTLSQQDNRDECLDTLNQQMLHFDQPFAAHTEWGRCLMDSTLTTKVVMGMTWKTFAMRTELLGFDEIALTSPVFGGDTLYAESEVLACEARDDGGGEVRVRTRGVTPAGGTAATFVYALIVPLRGPEEGEPSLDLRHGSHVEVAAGTYRERMGLFLEDIEPGDTYEHRPGWACSAAQSARETLRALDHSGVFASWHPGQRDRDRGAGINPLHILAAVTGMQTKTFSHIVANLAWQQVRFPEPARDGETVYAESTVLDARVSRSRAGQGVVHLRTRAITDEGRTVCTFERKVLVYARGHGPYEVAGY
jgi:itaconyl-CoA hydratase